MVLGPQPNYGAEHRGHLLFLKSKKISTVRPSKMLNELLRLSLERGTKQILGDKSVFSGGQFVTPTELGKRREEFVPTLCLLGPRLQGLKL
jgi:hypothetical protein